MAEKNISTSKLILFFFVVLACYGLFLHPLPGDNVNSRLDLAASLINQKLIHINRYHTNTIDKAYANGHFYSDKAPGMSWWTTILAYPLQKIIFFRVDPNSMHFRYAAAILIVSIPSAIAATLLALLMIRFGVSVGRSLTVASFFALGTLHFPYSTMFYSHALTSSFGILIFFIVFRHRRNGGTMGPGAALLCGLLAGAMVAGEYPAALTAALLFVYSLFAVRRWWHAAFFIIGMIPFAASVMTYNNAAFGSPFTTGYVHESLPVFYEGMDKGFAGITVPSLATIYKILISPGRGFLWQSPFLLFAIPGWLAMRRRGEYRIEAWVILAIAAEVIAVGVSAYMPEGGMAVGPRYLIPTLPFLCIPLVFLSFEKAWLRRIFLGLGIASIVLMFVATVTDPQVPREFDATIVEFNLPLLLMGAIRATALNLNQFQQIILPIAILVLLVAAFISFFNETSTERSSTAFTKEIFFALAILSAFLGAFYLINTATASPNESRKICRMGSYLSRSGHYEDAMKWYERGINGGGNAWECRFGLGLLRQKRNEYDEAEKHYLELVRQGIMLPQIYHNLGEIHIERGLRESALGMFEKSAALHLASNDADSAAKVYLKMASQMEKSGDRESAEKIYKKAIDTAPHSEICYFNYYFFLVKSDGRKEDVNKLLKTASERIPMQWRFNALRIENLIGLDRKKEAADSLKEIQKRFRNDPEARKRFSALKHTINSGSAPRF